MAKIKGIYAAGMSVLNADLSLNVEKTILHSEKLIEQGCHGIAIFGSTGQAQLIPIAEKIDLLNKLSSNKYKNNYVIGTGLNSLGETINLIKISLSLGFKKFLVMPPAYYKYEDSGVETFYSKIIEKLNDIEIILYNFEKLSGYRFSESCVKELVRRFPDQVVGIKDSTYNLFEKIQIENFSVLPGSESKLLSGLNNGCSGIMTATCNVTANLSRKVYDDYFSNNIQTHNKKLCDVRKAFENFDLISGLHTFYSKEDKIYQNLLPPLRLLNNNEKKKLMDDLKDINFNFKLFEVT